jgi:hypothetical protein
MSISLTNGRKLGVYITSTNCTCTDARCWWSRLKLRTSLSHSEEPRADFCRVKTSRSRAAGSIRDSCGLSSLIPRQLAASPMLVFARRVEHPFNVTVERSHHANSREHCRPIMFGNQHERLHCSLPFLGIVFSLRQLGDAKRHVALGDQPLALRQFDRLGKGAVPRHNLNHIVPVTKRYGPGACSEGPATVPGCIRPTADR